MFFTKNRFHHKQFASDLKKSLFGLKRSICSGACFQCSCEWYIEQIKLLKMINFRRLSNNPQEIYEVSVLEACRV